MKYYFFLFLLLAISGQSLADDWKSFSWTELKSERKLKAGTVLSPDDNTPFEQLRLTGPSRYVTLLTIENPQITKTGFNITGQVKYHGVMDNSSLEMVAIFPSGRTFSVKAVGPNYSELIINGSADWTNFFMVFYLSSSLKEKPNKIQVQIHLPAQGTIFLSPLNLSQFNKGTPVQIITSGISNIFLFFLALALAPGLALGLILTRKKPGKWVLAFIIPMMFMGSLLLLFGTLALTYSGEFVTYTPYAFLGAGEILLPWVLRARAINRLE
jgi:hypothetical protein